ncbi:hypothetical protein L207DRAFT_531614 [Hyaloscypha variabilis F]|jgi:hypothetical protein|uniref:Uncharacterized protein n=1 Tax=Hyaloscypha variabilis (strain UAMH 11265 / GT02V1 / F) TaxID=1149755 RepID=A0A2J6RFL2_HYAVF|nr:hypothetical protein L207DRAFT_531614 [Hyaloscypha variabilis F]
MPLLTTMDSLRENGHEKHSVLAQHQGTEDLREEGVQDSRYEHFDQDDQDEGMDSDSSIMHRGRPKKPVKTPVVPQRSEKRASRLLENVMLELQNLDGSRQKEEDKISIVQESDPHELYLSSEEDASFSDYDDSFSDFEEGTHSEDAEATRKSSSRASSRKSQEDTARVVSFVSVKPVIVDIYLPNTSPSSADKRLSLNLEKLASFNTTPKTSPQKSTRRPTPLKLYPAFRRMSISSIASLSSSSPSSTTGHPYAASTTDLALMSSTTNTLPPRKSSRLASNLTSLVTNTKNSFQSASQSAHTFLNSDPFATPTSVTSMSTSYIPPSKKVNNNIVEEKEEQTPKTPTSAWKRSFLSKARKPSMPKLSLAYTAGVVRPRENSDASNPPTEQEKEEKVSSEPTETAESGRESLRISTVLPQTSSSESTKSEAKDDKKVKYEEVIQDAGEVIKSPASIPTPKERRAMAFGRLVRTKSGKGRPVKPQVST